MIENLKIAYEISREYLAEHKNVSAFIGGILVGLIIGLWIGG
jgi:F0F1-type ATP synthase assembly protein I